MKIKATMKAFSAAAALAALLGWTGCDRPPQLDVRTFPLEGLRDYEATLLIQPYVYELRTGFHNPQTCNLQTEVLLICRINQFRQNRIVKYTPPVFVI